MKNEEEILQNIENKENIEYNDNMILNELKEEDEKEKKSLDVELKKYICYL